MSEIMIKAERAYINAQQYHRMVRYFNRLPDDGETMMVHFLPIALCTSFATELYFKSIILMQGGRPSRTHKLLELFQSTKKETQRELEEIYRIHIDAYRLRRPDVIEYFEKEHGLNVTPDLTDMLSMDNDAFVQYRYSYEAPNTVTSGVDFGFLEVLFEYIFREQPAWRHMLLD